MAWTGAVAKVHCDVISAETYLENAIRTLDGMEPGTPCQWILPMLHGAVELIALALPHLEQGVSPEVIEMLHGQVMPIEKGEE